MLLIDQQGAFHVTYRGARVGSTNTADVELRYAHRSPGEEWKIESATNADGVVGQQSFTVDGFGALHVSYSDWSTGHLKYAYRAPDGTWTASSIDTDGLVGEPNSLAVDPSGDVHVSYYDGTPQRGNLKYAHKLASGEWSTAILQDEWDYMGQVNALTVDNEGGLHVVFYDHGENRMRYSHLSPGATAWQTENIGDLRRTHSPSMVVDASGVVHVSACETNAFATFSFGDVTYSRRSPDGTWSTMNPPPGPNDGNVPPQGGDSCPLAVDSEGGVHLTYSDPIHDRVGYSYLPSAGEWTSSTIVGKSDLGYYSSVAVDASGEVHVVYEGRPFETSLRYAHRCTPHGS